MEALRTPRLSLTPWHPRDTDALLALVNTPDVRRYLFDDEPVARDWVEAAIRDSTARFAAGTIGLFVARLGDAPLAAPAPSPPAGFVGFIQVYVPPVVELVYALATEHTRRGLATEMARAVIDRAFEHHGFDAVRASVDEPNEDSARVLERLGLTPAATSRGPRHTQRHYELPRARWRRDRELR